MKKSNSKYLNLNHRHEFAKILIEELNKIFLKLVIKQKIYKKIHHTLYWNSFLESKKEEAHEANEYAKFKGHPDVHRLLKNKESTLKKECNKTEKKFTQKNVQGI